MGGHSAHFAADAVAGGTVIWVAAAGVVINTISALLFLAGRERDLNVKGAFFQHGSQGIREFTAGHGFYFEST